MKLHLKFIGLTSLVLAGFLLFTGAVLAQGPNDGGADPPKEPNARLAALAESLDMPADDLKAALKAGQTIEDIAAEQGFDMPAVAQSLHSQAVSMLEQAVNDGKINQEQADKIQAKLDERLDACVNEGECKLFPNRRALQQRCRQRHNRRAQIGRQAVKTIAETLDMPVADLVQQFKSGSSLEEIAAEQGVLLETITDALYTQADDRIAQAVADGKISQEQADKMLANLESKLENCASGGQCFGRGQRNGK